MAIVDAPFVKCTTTTTGTGTITVDAAVPGFVSIITATGDGNRSFYYLHDANGIDKEFGLNTVTTAGSLMARTTILASTNGGSAISLTSGTHIIANDFVPGYATGNVNFQDLLLQRPELRDYSETVGTPSISAGTLVLDLETANVFNVTHNANITTLTISNPPASGKCGNFTLHLTQDATGGRTLTFPASIKWSGGTVATITTTASKKNKFVFDTLNGGTSWDCALIGKDYA